MAKTKQVEDEVKPEDLEAPKDDALDGEEQVELSVDEYNAQVSVEIAKLQSEIDKLKKTYKSEAERKQVDLHDCLTKFPR